MSTLVFKFYGRVIPKQRPRSRGKTHYLPPGYAKWKSENVSRIAQEWQELHKGCDPEEISSISLCKVDIILYGKFLGDIDNISGAILDVLVQAKVLCDDNLSVIPRLTIEHFHKKEPVGATVELSKISTYYTAYNCPANYFED